MTGALKSFCIAVALTVGIIFILSILALFQYYWVNPRNVVVAIPSTGQLYFLQNQSYVQTNVTTRIVDLCVVNGELLIIAADGTLYDTQSAIRYTVPIQLSWCAVRAYDNHLFVGSDQGIYKFPGPFRERWLMEPGTQFVDWHDDEFVKMDTSFRFVPTNDRTIVYLDKGGFLTHRSLGDNRRISHQWVGTNVRGIAFI